jgi:integrase
MAKRGKKQAKRTNGDGYLKQKKNGRWEGYATLGHDAKGKPIRQYFTCDTRDQALARMDELRLQRMRATDIEAYKLTLTDYLERWLSYKNRELRRTTYNEYSKVVKQRIIPNIGQLLLVKLRPLDVEEFITTLFDAGDSVATVRAVLKVLKAALNQAVTWNLIASSPAARVKKPKKQEREIKVWSSAEVLKFLETAKVHKLHSRLYPLFHLALSTGMRRGEILGLEWCDIVDDTITVKRSLVAIDSKIELSEPKTQSSKRKIFLSSDTVEVLNAHRARQLQEVGNFPIVFTALDGSYLKPRALHHAYFKVMKDAGVPRIRFHDMRHVHASLLIRNQISPMVVAQRLGHSDESMLKIYVHLYEEQKREAALPLATLLN